ncbi:MAG: tetratricopeptide repeat protein [Myxococcales bacterium]|nr:tetratricopeptide repeat protein [Myxococcales bacterium]
MRRISSLSGLLGLALLWMPAAVAHAQSAADRVDGVDASEVEALRATKERFRARMVELEQDTRSYVDLREEEELTKLVGGYDSLISALETQERQQRDIAITRFERFLERYPTTGYASHVRFRLADLYFERSTELWQADAEAYFTKLEDPDLPIEELEALGEQPQRDLGQSLDLYLRIIEDNVGLPEEERYERLDGTYVMLGFVYNDRNNVQFDEAKARQSFLDLIASVPESDLVDRSHLFLGNFAFADNDFDTAIASYEAVYDKGSESKYYMEGLYQLAWAQYKLNRFDDALRLFTELLDASHQSKLDSGRESAFAPDARRFMAFSFADLGYDRDAPAEQIAQSYFEGIGQRPYERDVYIELADVLVRYTRPEEAIATYRELQGDDRWVLEPDNPAHQIALIRLYQTSVARDLEKAGEERLSFIDTYSEGTTWWEANRNDPEALEVARSYIEDSLLDVAIEYRVRAQDSGRSEDFQLAAAKYEEYLDKFPISDDYYTQQWYLADSLKQAGQYDEALNEFDSLVRTSRYHEFGDAARYASMDVRYQEMLAKGHMPNEPPAEAQVERTYQAGGKEIQVFALSQDRSEFLVAADAVVAHDFTGVPTGDLPDYREEVEEKRPLLMYVGGQMLFYHNRFREARERFEALIARYPRTIEANYAAGLLVDSFLAEGDLEQVRAYTLRFTVNPPGPTSETDTDQFQGTLEGTTFKLAMERANNGDNLAAAEAFLAFREEFPDSELDTDALYNAAFYYQKAGKVEQSNELYERFVVDHPDDKRSKGLFFRIAANYEAAFELEKAESYYDRVLSHPDATQTERADAQFNRSFLLIGLGRHKEAAEGFETYDRRYTAQEDRESILWLAGEQWEQVGNKEAIDFYQRYLERYPSENPDHAIEAQSRLLALYQDSGAQDWRIRRQKKAILETFGRLASQGAEIGANGHRYAAQADYPRLEALFADYSDEALSGNEDRDATLLNETKPEELKAFEAEVKGYISKFKSFEFNSGALLLQARAALYLADLGLSISCPPNLSEEDCWLYEDILQEKVFPQYYEIEDVGIRRLQELIAAAKDKKRHSPFIDEALAELNRRRPAEFPAVKQEIEGGTDASIPVEYAPRRLGDVGQEGTP